MSQQTKDEKFADDITFSVNNQQDTDDYSRSRTLGSAAKEVLGQLGDNTDLSRWNLTHEGNKLDFDQTFEEAEIPDEATLVLSNKPGNKA